MDELEDQQRVVRRSRAFVVVPTAVAVVLGINLLWAILRANVSESSLDEWPYRFATTDAATAAVLVVAVASLIVARLQWAHANRPQIGFAIDDEEQRFLVDSDRWQFWIFNAGPGVAVVEQFDYRVLTEGQDRPIAPLEWVSLDRANEILRAEGLKDGTSFFVRQISAGAPLPPTTHYTNGSRFAYFTVGALALIQRFDVRVVVRDSLGDVHECVFPAMDRLPTVTTKAIRTRGRAGTA